MPDDNSQPTSSAPPRPKPSRGSTIGVVRPRASSPGPASNEQTDGRPPTKRARKAINCEPCRNSKLKCDRNRPCSSCVLRGTSALCYQDARGHEGSESFTRGDDHHHSRIDPAQEIARLRHSISLLESHIFPHQRNINPLPRRNSDPSNIIPKKEVLESNIDDKTNAGMLASQGEGGLYAGPTSAATHLLLVSQSDGACDSRQESQDRFDDFSTMPPEYDRDLLALLPPLETIDGLVLHYFEYCNWIYRHVNEVAFKRNWERFKNGSSSDRIILATVSVIMAVAVHYLPTNHQLLESFTETVEEIGHRFYDVARTALKRRQAECRTYNIELVELLLIRCHFQTLSKKDSEEIWSVRGELITIGMAMGLHRDPGKFRMHRDVAERRRWAWWHIVLLERWQAFMFGRPIAIASHHFDTQLPSYCDPAIDKTGRLYLPNIALFRLAYILGDVMDDAVSVRPVSYESVMANDRALTQWMESLPSELDLDDYRIARNLASNIPAVRRFGVQSVIIRTSYYHIRFTLHRPYASAAANPNSGYGKLGSVNTAQSLEIAVGAADKLITMVGQSRPDFLANTSLAVPGHMNWGPFHCFSAAMFFSFQLIANPDQPGAGLFRDNIRKAIGTLEQSRGSAVADKAYDILHALAPLYSAEFPQEPEDVREKKQAAVLSTVRKLAFPYHDSHSPRTSSDSPGCRGNSSPSNSNSVSPPLGMMPMPPQYDTSTALTLSIKTAPGHQHLNSPYMPPQMQGGHGIHPSLSQSPHLQHHQQLSPSSLAHPHLSSAPPSVPYPSQASYQMPSQNTQPSLYADSARYATYSHPVDDSTMWGASVGFGQGEWAQFLNVMQRPDTSPSSTRSHLTA